MASLIAGYDYDTFMPPAGRQGRQVFISCRQKDNKHYGRVSELKYILRYRPEFWPRISGDI
jgi:hypothetical protein